MIAYIKGELAEVTAGSVVVDCGGVGYEIFMPASMLSDLPAVGSTVKIHTHFHVREDAMTLYGFLTKEDLRIFAMLIAVNGIGPKGALGVLSAITPDELRLAVLSDDVKTICRAPGIGAKTAQKMIIELRDKMKLEEIFDNSDSEDEGWLAGQTDAAGAEDITKEAVMALTALGYTASEAAKAVRGVALTPDMSVEELLKAALKKIF